MNIAILSAIALTAITHAAPARAEHAPWRADEREVAGKILDVRLSTVPIESPWPDPYCGFGLHLSDPPTLPDRLLPYRGRLGLPAPAPDPHLDAAVRRTLAALERRSQRNRVGPGRR